MRPAHPTLHIYTFFVPSCSHCKLSKPPTPSQTRAHRTLHSLHLLVLLFLTLLNRMCLSNTKFCVKEVDIGLAADVGTLSRLGKIMGLTSFTKEICLSARVFTPEEAFQNNFISKIVQGTKADLINAGVEMARLIASKSPVAVQGTKNILDASWGRTVEDNLNYTAVWNAGMLQSSDVERAMTSGLRKAGTPRFEKL